MFLKKKSSDLKFNEAMSPFAGSLLSPSNSQDQTDLLPLLRRGSSSYLRNPKANPEAAETKQEEKLEVAQPPKPRISVKNLIILQNISTQFVKKMSSTKLHKDIESISFCQ